MVYCCIFPFGSPMFRNGETVIATLCTEIDVNCAYKNIEANHMDIKNEGTNGVIV